MVEVEHDRIGLPAVNTRMSEQVGEQQGAVLDPVAVDPSDLAADVVVAIREVMLASIRGLAFPTVPLTTALRYVVESEVRFGLGLADM